MKVLFCVTNFGFLRNFQSTLALLAHRGHQLHLVADRTDSTGGMQMVTDLVRAYPSTTYEISPPVQRRLWFAFTSVVRLTLDYWRYLEPRFANAVQLRARAERQVPRVMVRLVHLPVLRTPAARRLLTRLLRAVERVIPSRPEVVDLIRRQNPDVVLLTPLLYFGSRQVEHVRAAKAAGIPTLLGVGSWDHLTTKGRIHEVPDYVAVWNEMQRAEAVELHGVDPSRVIVTGAQAYDHWFAARPGTSREEFCGRVGLPPDRPYLLYLCSSPFITPHEVPFVRRWIEAIRGSRSERLRSAGILIRPHPQNAEQWRDVDLSPYGHVAIWPRAGANPIDAAAKTEYFDSMHHSHAVAGVNTSALIESGIVGRRVYSLLVPEFSATQDGTLHFQHLKNVEGGLLRLASTLDEHVGHLAAALEPQAADEDRTVRGFVQAFVRPHGLDVAAAPRFVAALESVAAEGRRAPQRTPAPALVGRVLLTPVAFALMVAAIDRDRWWSFALHVTRPPRLLVRAAWKGAYERRQGARRIVRNVARRSVRGCQSVARRALGRRPAGDVGTGR